MELIERYVYQVGKRLPSKNRGDIVSELRSSLEDQLDARSEGEPSEAQAVELLTEMGSPESVAASYYPEGQYLIGPTLYPLFRMVVGIVLAVVIVAQLIGIAAGVIFSQGSINLLQTLLTLVQVVPIAIGWLVIVFAILQRYGVEPDSDDEPFDPRQLPVIGVAEPVSRGEQAFSIIFGVALLALLMVFYGPGASPSGYLANPVISQYLPWMILVLALGILIDIVLLWQGEWRTSTRITKLLGDLLSLLVIGLIIQDHTTLLNAAGIEGFGDGMDLVLAEDAASQQIFGMVFFRIIFIVAFIVTGIEAAVQVIRLIQATLRKDQLGSTGLADA